MKRIVCLITLVLVAAGMAGVVATPARAHDRAAVEKAVAGPHQQVPGKSRPPRRQDRDAPGRLGPGPLAGQDAVPRLLLARLGERRELRSERLRAAGYKRSGYGSWGWVGEVIGWGKGSARHGAGHLEGLDGLERPSAPSSWTSAGVTWASAARGAATAGSSGTLMYTVDFGRRAR